MGALVDRFRAVLLASAIGDALGSPVEGLSKMQIARIFGKIRDFTSSTFLQRSAGVCTDDTELAILTAKSIVERKKLDIEDIRQKFCMWFDGKPPSIGATTALSLSFACREKLPLDLYPRLVLKIRGDYSAGNGALMRIHPVALYDVGDQNMLHDVRIVSMITHPHSDSVECCQFLCKFIEHLINGDRDAAIQNSLKEVKLQPHIKKAIITAPKLSEDQLSTTGYVLHTLQIALWAFYTTDTLEDAIIKAVNVGGDTDTYGAVCGAIAGAFYGRSAIPQRWKTVRVFDMGYNEIEELGTMLYNTWVEKTKNSHNADAGSGNNTLTKNPS